MNVAETQAVIDSAICHCDRARIVFEPLFLRGPRYVTRVRRGCHVVGVGESIGLVTYGGEGNNPAMESANMLVDNLITEARVDRALGHYYNQLCSRYDWIGSGFKFLDGFLARSKLTMWRHRRAATQRWGRFGLDKSDKKAITQVIMTAFEDGKRIEKMLNR
jgi:flavin-dependent dehydrogenase